MATKKQAVLLIHGIGNQQPMQTLRSFVEAVWTDHKAIHNQHAGHEVWSKPDEVSKSFELRKLTTPQNSHQIRTDFYEFYWAHLMHGTGYGHVIGWIKSLLCRRPCHVAPGLKGAYYVLWTVLLCALLVMGRTLWLACASQSQADPTVAEKAAVSFWWSLAGLLVNLVLLPVCGSVMKEIIGDAARYLRPAPQNIQRRHEIRAEGVKLLHTLHERGYDRIIVVGHSLGSVIGYDILTYAFPSYNVPVHAEKARDKEQRALEKIAQDIEANQPHPVDSIQRAQRAYFEELEEVGCKWRVTDFITLGSPLAHAEVLMANNQRELGDKITLRELPVCLPALEQTIRTTDPANRHFTYGPQPTRTSGIKVPIPHHAAVFAPTRWTNMYFPMRALAFGDLIGGPVARVFGAGVRDVAVGTSRYKGLFSHTFYWRQTNWCSVSNANQAEAVTALREVLDLTDRGSGLSS